MNQKLRVNRSLSKLAETRAMLLIKLLSRLPFWFLYFFAELAAFLGYHIIKYRKSVVMENLSTAFPDKSQTELQRIARGFYRHFSQLWVELIKSYSFDVHDWRERMSVTNFEDFKEFLDKGVPVILMSGHSANWEWPAYSVSSQMEYPLDFIYKPAESKVVNEILSKLRTKHGGRGVIKDRALRSMIKERKTPRVIGMVADQLPSIGTEKKWIEFLNRQTAFYVGTERIAQIVQHPVFYGECIRKKRGYYEITFHLIAKPPIDGKDDPRIIESFVSLLNKTIDNNPSDYLWSHKRWKYTKEEEEAVLASSK